MSEDAILDGECLHCEGDGIPGVVGPYPDEEEPKWYVQCARCSSDGPYGNSINEAILAWLGVHDGKQVERLALERDEARKERDLLRTELDARNDSHEWNMLIEGLFNASAREDALKAKIGLLRTVEHYALRVSDHYERNIAGFAPSMHVMYQGLVHALKQWAKREA